MSICEEEHDLQSSKTYRLELHIPRGKQCIQAKLHSMKNSKPLAGQKSKALSKQGSWLTAGVPSCCQSQAGCTTASDLP